MWCDKDALIAIEKYFRTDEKYFRLQKQPWRYSFSVKVTFALFFFVAFCAIVLVNRERMPRGVILLFLLTCFYAFYYLVLRCIYPNYILISKYAIYRYIGRRDAQVDEIQWSEVEKIRVNPMQDSQNSAFVTIKCRPEYIRKILLLKQKHTIKHARKHPLGLDFRDLTITKPLSLHFVVHDYDEWLRDFRIIRESKGYSYRIDSKGYKEYV